MIGFEKTKKLLLEGDFTCVLSCGEKVYTSKERGVKPLLTWFESGADFKGYFAADKVVGKATAFLYILLGVKAVYAGVISRSALNLLGRQGVLTEYGNVVEHIINRKGDGICPFEAAVLNIDDADAAYAAIRQKMNEIIGGIL